MTSLVFCWWRVDVLPASFDVSCSRSDVKPDTLLPSHLDRAPHSDESMSMPKYLYTDHEPNKSPVTPMSLTRPPFLSYHNQATTTAATAATAAPAALLAPSLLASRIGSCHPQCVDVPSVTHA